MKASKYILSLLLISLSTISISSATPVGHLPAKHYAANIKTSNRIVEDACKALRENSPFAEEFVKSHTETQLDGELNAITSYAEKFLGTRYRLGASGPNRFDCSGFVGYVFRNFGYNLNRDSRSQYLQGDKVETAELRPGDLLFFSSRSSGKGRVGHVAIVLTVNPDGSCTFIHASSSKKGVVRQKFPDNGYYSKHFIGAKRIVGSSQFS
ncbi:MAG: C40 family peptidase [Duncaniella sp.]|nr:C40 family peptidase [Duncaniella sp.]